jgi:hypothetical protein
MERGSDKHGPRADEEMKEETQAIVKGAPVDSRVEPFRIMEPDEEDEDATEEAPPPAGEADLPPS